MYFADIHNHALFDCDDGAKTKKEMYRMIDIAYASGTRLLCFTPHYHPGYFGDNRKKSEQAFSIARAYAEQRYPDLQLCIGNELRYDSAAVSWLEADRCRTMNGTKYVLVDFLDSEDFSVIEKGLYRLIRTGYIPILAHVERYRSLHWNINRVERVKQLGIVLQMDSGALTGKFGWTVKAWSKKLLRYGVIDVFSSDAHDTKVHTPDMRQAYEQLHRLLGNNFAADICNQAATDILTPTYEQERK